MPGVMGLQKPLDPSMGHNKRICYLMHVPLITHGTGTFCRISHDTLTR